MPVPKPSKDESQDAFMSRCMGFMTKENEHKEGKDKRPRKQLVAICFSQWRKKSSSSSEEDIEEPLNEFVRVFLEKYPQYTEYFKEESK